MGGQEFEDMNRWARDNARSTDLGRHLREDMSNPLQV